MAGGPHSLDYLNTLFTRCTGKGNREEGSLRSVSGLAAPHLRTKTRIRYGVAGGLALLVSSPRSLRVCTGKGNRGEGSLRPVFGLATPHLRNKPASDMM